MAEHVKGDFASKTPAKKKINFSQIRDVFWELVWPRRGLLFLGLFLILINRVSGLVLPGSTKYLIDDVITKDNRDLLWKLAIGVFIAVAIQAVSSYLLTQLLSLEAQKLIAELRVKIQRHIGRLPVNFYDEQKSGALVSRIMNDVEGVRNLIGTGLVSLIGGLLTAVGAFVLLIRINYQMTFISLAFVTFFALISFQAFKKIRPIFRERGKINAEVTGRLTESLGGVRIIKGFHAEERESIVFEQGAERIFTNIKRTLTANSFVAMTATLFVGVISVIMMLMGGTHILNGTMTLGDFFAYTLYLGVLVVPIVQMTNIGTQLTEAFAGLDRMQEIFAIPTEHADPERQNKLYAFRGHIVFQDVSFAYDSGKVVLDNVSLEAKPGSVTALVGSSGAGKSTLISLVAAFAKPKSGTIFVDDQNLNSIVLDDYRSQMAVVLQDNFLFDGSIRDNLLFGRPDASEDEMLSAAKLAFVSEFAEKFDEGYNTIIGERGVKLSGGQRQRIAIARAVLADPKLLILDEATSSLDSESERYIQEGLQTLMKGRTTFVIAHRLSTILHADQILVLESGKIVEQGKHAELLEKKGRYHHLYTVQMRI